MNAEEVKVGCFQMLLVLFLGINYAIVSMSHALPAFHNYTPKFYYQAKNGTNKTYDCQYSINSNQIIKNTTSASQEGSTSTSLCTGEYHFVIEPGENSVVTEWALVCDKRHLSYLGPIVYYFGALIGAWIVGILADHIGRVPVQAICLYAQGTMAVALYVARNYPTFLALRCLQGVFVQGLQNSTYILSLELFPRESRTFVALIMQIFWAMGLILLAFLSYVIPDWRILQLAISVPTAITVLYIWIIPESPRWLLAKRKSTEADMVLERVTKYNGFCIKMRKEGPIKLKIDENLAPIKSERKSRVSNIDTKKLETTNEVQNDSISAPMTMDVTQQKIRKASSNAISENLKDRFSDARQHQGSSLRKTVTIETKDSLSCSRNQRKSRLSSQSTYDCRISLTAAEEIVVLRHPSKREKVRNENEVQQNDNVDDKFKNEKNETLKELFKCRAIRKYGFITFLQWFSSSIACHLLGSFLPIFSNNRHITFALGAVLEVATYIFIYFVLSRYGRRLPMGIYQFTTGVICIAIAVLVELSYPSVALNDFVKSTLLLLGRVTVSSIIVILYLYAVEIFPTVVRGTCLGLCTVFAEIGSLSTPHILSLGVYLSVSVPFIIIGTICFISAILAFSLPETLNKVLPDTIKDAESLTTKKKVLTSHENLNSANKIKEDLSEREVLREKLFSEDWVDAGNGILINFSENKNSE